MGRRTSTLDLIAAEFADAVADGDLLRAEGWIATALLVAERERRVEPRTSDAPQ